MAPGDPVLVPRGGRFIGSTGSTTIDQLAADVYLQDIWTSQGHVFRLAVACIGWGLSAAFIQRAIAPQPGQPGPWTVANLLVHTITVQDFGQQMVDVPNVPQPLPNDVLPGIIQFDINGIDHFGSRMPWHHRLVVDVEDVWGQHLTLHYHKHEPRQERKGGPPKILPKARGKHLVFDELVFNTQIQNCRRARPTPE